MISRRIALSVGLGMICVLFAVGVRVMKPMSAAPQSKRNLHHGLLFPRGTAFDGGVIQDEKSVHHIFEFTNVGTDVLTIDDIQLSCGCTEATTDKDSYQPGESGYLRAGMKLSPFGPSSVSMAIYTNRSTSPLILTMRAERRPAVHATVVPKIINMDVNANDPTIATIYLVHRTDIATKLDPVIVNSGFVTGEIQSIRKGNFVANGYQQTILDLRVLPTSVAKPGKDRLLLRFGSPLNSDIAVDVHLSQLQRISASPRDVLFLKSPEERLAKPQEVKIRASPPSAVEVKLVTNDFLDWLDVATVETTAGTSIRLSPRAAPIHERLDGEIVLKAKAGMHSEEIAIGVRYRAFGPHE